MKTNRNIKLVSHIYVLVGEKHIKFFFKLSILKMSILAGILLMVLYIHSLKKNAQYTYTKTRLPWSGTQSNQRKQKSQAAN